MTRTTTLWSLLLLSAALALGSCTKDATEQATGPEPEAKAASKLVFSSENAVRGELLVCFGEEAVAGIESSVMQVTRSGGVATRSGIADFDAVLGSIGVKALQRLFPVDERNEERTRAAGLHRWYVVEFDAAADLDKAALDMARIAEVSKVEFNQQLMHVHEGRRVQRSPPGQTMALHQHRRQVDLFEDQGGSRCQLRRGLEALHGRPARYRRGRGQLRAVGPSRPGRQHVDQHRRAERLGRP